MKIGKDTHIIHFHCDITQLTVERLRNVLLSLSKMGAGSAPSDILVEFTSLGGDVAAGLTAYHTIREISIPLSVCNVNTIESMGIMVFLAFDRRYAMAHSKYMIHSISKNLPGGAYNLPTLREVLGGLAFDVERCARLYDERTQGALAPLNPRECFAGSARIFGAEDAVSHGIVHSIVLDDAFRTATTAHHHWIDSTP